MKTFIIEGTQTILDGISADDRDQAEKLFRAKYPGALIKSVLEKSYWIADRKAKLNDLQITLKSAAEKHFNVRGVKVEVKVDRKRNP